MAAANPESSPPLGSADLSLLDKALKQLEKLHKLCMDPQLGLRNSPPYLPELVSETSALLVQVWEPYRGCTAAGGRGPRRDEARYLRVHIRNLLDKTNRAVLLFRQGRERIYEEMSSYRRNLTKLSLLFSHILWELKAMFPGGSFQGNTYKVHKAEAGEFWRQSFGNKCIVQWNSFKEKLRNAHAFEDGMESMALKSTIDLTCNDHISVFEFDIFTRLFQPWRSLIRNWNQLAVIHPGYMAFLTYDQVIARLEHYLHKPGSFIFRLSCTRMGQWAIGHVTTEATIVQTIPQNTPLHLALIEGFKEGCYLYPDGRDLNPNLTSLCEQAQRGKVKVTEEQYELYCDIGSTFQLCKICTERDKDTRIQPCGHLLCQTCLTGWQKSAGHTCPYCRCDIRGTETVLIEPYRPAGQAPDDRVNEDTDEDDHEDIEVIVKELAAFRTQPRSCLGVPPLPPKNSLGPLSSPQPSQPQTSEIKTSVKYSHSFSVLDTNEGQRKHKPQNNTNRCEGQESQLRDNQRPSVWRRSLPCLLSDRTEFPTEASVPSRSQKDVSGGIAWMGPVKERKARRREEKHSKKTNLASE